MTRKVFAFTAALVAGCVTLPPENTYQRSLEIWNTVKDRPDYAAYSGAFIRFNNEVGLDERNGCYWLLTTSTELIVEVAESGKVVAASTSTDDQGTKCFRDTFRGVVGPRPPVAPFAVKLRMNRPKGTRDGV